MVLLRRLDPERAHILSLRALRAVPRRPAPFDPPALAVEALGLRLTNPFGLAAGFDKDAVALRGLSQMGFGFIEVGTVTPRPQPGNPRPRLFRLREDAAAINRFGFNGAGIEAFLARLHAHRRHLVPVGANIGINRDATHPPADYAALARVLAPVADYITINVSSPNTPGLAALQAADQLRPILAAIRAASPRLPPLLVKLSPDLPDAALPGVLAAVLDHGVGGLIVCNTTATRPSGLRALAAGEAGGLSGQPLAPLARAMLRKVAFLAAADLAAGRLVLVASGGIASGADALERLRAGAALVQLYTGFAYDGPALLGRMKRELRAGLRAAGLDSVQAAIGADLRAGTVAGQTSEQATGQGMMRGDDNAAA